jgi:hypothetical protein
LKKKKQKNFRYLEGVALTKPGSPVSKVFRAFLKNNGLLYAGVTIPSCEACALELPKIIPTSDPLEIIFGSYSLCPQFSCGCSACQFRSSFF